MWSICASWFQCLEMMLTIFHLWLDAFPGGSLDRIYEDICWSE